MFNMQKLEKIATIIGAFGIRGQVKIFSEVLELHKFKPFLKDSNLNSVKFTSCNQHKGDIWLGKIEGIETCNQAESLINTELFAHQDEFPARRDGYYNFQLINLQVLEENSLKNLGFVQNVLDFKHTKLLEIQLQDLNFSRGNISQNMLYIDIKEIISLENNTIIVKEITEIINADQ